MPCLLRRDDHWSSGTFRHAHIRLFLQTTTFRTANGRPYLIGRSDGRSHMTIFSGPTGPKILLTQNQVIMPYPVRFCIVVAASCRPKPFHPYPLPHNAHGRISSLSPFHFHLATCILLCIIMQFCRIPAMFSQKSCIPAGLFRFVASYFADLQKFLVKFFILGIAFF